MRKLVAVCFAALAGILVIKQPSVAEETFCYGCDENGKCGAAVAAGGDTGCQTSWLCVEGRCSSLCSPEGEICGIPEAISMSGQIVIASGPDAERLRADGEETEHPGVYRRACDRALVVIDSERHMLTSQMEIAQIDLE